jgi:hypothetical protein
MAGIGVAEDSGSCVLAGLMGAAAKVAGTLVGCTVSRMVQAASSKSIRIGSGPCRIGDFQRV